MTKVINIEPLTDEEAQTLQVDAALRKIAELDKAYNELGIEIEKASRVVYQKEKDLLDAKMMESVWRSAVKMLSQRHKALDTIVKRA